MGQSSDTMRTKITNCLPPEGPSLSFERFSMEFSTIPWSVLDLVVAEKLIINLLFVAGMSARSPMIWTVLPTPVLPTTSKLCLDKTTV
mmetsp:Transcript_14527/g.44843  ORF Transcript_14527/g.44843 Transcript_14527/m.44843 type:complete len:88 (+) Transcript_14527:6324-6587(+)